MAGFYQTFTTTRVTEADYDSLFNTLRTLDATVGIQHDIGTKKYILKKSTAWTAPQIATAQNTIDTAPANTPQLTAQGQIDKLSIVQKAIILALLDEINILRTALTLPTRTPAQAIAAIRNKAATL